MFPNPLKSSVIKPNHKLDVLRHWYQKFFEKINSQDSGSAYWSSMANFQPNKQDEETAQRTSWQRCLQIFLHKHPSPQVFTEPHSPVRSSRLLKLVISKMANIKTLPNKHAFGKKLPSNKGFNHAQCHNFLTEKRQNHLPKNTNRKISPRDSLARRKKRVFKISSNKSGTTGSTISGINNSTSTKLGKIEGKIQIRLQLDTRTVATGSQNGDFFHRNDSREIYVTDSTEQTLTVVVFILAFALFAVLVNCIVLLGNGTDLHVRFSQESEDLQF